MAAIVLSAAAAHAQAVSIPRTADGHPDFQGVWEARWRTPLERPDDADGPVVDKDKANALIGSLYARSRAMGNQSPDSDADWAPMMPASGGGYRTSLIVDPADGKRPLSQAAKDREKAVREAADKAEGPEVRGYSERCLRANGAAPLGVGADQSYRQFIQTSDHVVIWTESLGDTRIIEMTGRTRPAALVSWFGDSSGHWEGDTLVVETRLARADLARPPASPGQPERKLTERFQLNNPDELGYSYVIEDPVMFTAPMRVAFIMVRTRSRMFESGCHEGNYGLPGILSGARAVEQRPLP